MKTRKRINEILIIYQNEMYFFSCVKILMLVSCLLKNNCLYFDFIHSHEINIRGCSAIGWAKNREILIISILSEKDKSI